MARMGRPTTNPATLDRQQLIDDILVMSSQVSDPIKRVAKTVSLMESHPEGFASATGSNMLGNGLRAYIRDAMVEAQNGMCFTCGVEMNNAKYPFTAATLFRLVPSIVGADETVSGLDAMNAGTVPGNVVATCGTCNTDRRRAFDATGNPVAVTHDVMHSDPDGSDMLNACRILYVWPSSVPKDARTDKAREDYVMANRRAGRNALLGW